MVSLALILEQPAWPMLAVGVFIALLGGSSLVAERLSAVTTSFFLVTSAAATWLAGAALMMLADDAHDALFFARLTYLGVCAIPAAVLQFSFALIEKLRARRLLVISAWAASASFAALFLTTDLLIRQVTRHPWGYYVALEPLAAVFVAFFAAVLVFSLAQLVASLRADVTMQQKNRVLAFIAALFVGYGGAIDFLPSLGYDAAPFGYLAVLGFVGLSIRAIRRFRFVDLSASFVADQLLATIDGGVLVVDTRGVIRVANAGAARLLNRDVESLKGGNISSILPNRELPVGNTPTLTRLGRASRVLRTSRDDGTPLEVSVAASVLRDRDQLPVGILYVLHDLAERRRAEVHEFAANHDPLTGVANRAWLTARFDEAAADAVSRARVTAVLFIDLDGFKAINDRYGHSIGDRLLQLVALRLKNALRSEDLFARWGGDEFVSVLSLGRSADATIVANKLNDVLREPLTVDRLTISVGASIGVALAPDDGATLGELVHAADAAMYKAKRARHVRHDIVAPSPTIVESRA